MVPQGTAYRGDLCLDWMVFVEKEADVDAAGRRAREKTQGLRFVTSARTPSTAGCTPATIPLFAWQRPCASTRVEAQPSHRGVYYHNAGAAACVPVVYDGIARYSFSYETHLTSQTLHREIATGGESISPPPFARHVDAAYDQAQLVVRLHSRSFDGVHLEGVKRYVGSGQHVS